eukprot:SAG11_NODE_32912_length_280_cov_0.574586_1_plen_49_part_01
MQERLSSSNPRWDDVDAAAAAEIAAAHTLRQATDGEHPRASGSKRIGGG